MPWGVTRKTLVRRGLAFGAIGGLVAGLLIWAGLYEPEYVPETVDQVESVPGEDFEGGAVELPEDGTEGLALEGDQAVSFPELTTTEVLLPAGESVEIEDFGLTVKAIGEEAPAALSVTLESASARDGLHWIFERADGSSAPAIIQVVFDYTEYRNAAGGDWDDRLIVVGADGTEIDSVNDAGGGTVTAEIALTRATSGGGSVATAYAENSGHLQTTATSPNGAVTLAASDSGDNGTFAATSLAPAASWSAGNPTGDFNWSYGIDVPTSTGSLDPAIGFAYSSTAVDGRNEATNNQPSTIGEGFSFDPGFIERNYTSCLADDEGDPNSDNMVLGSDVCWGTDNAVLSLNGAGGELVRDDATGEWKIKNDDNSKVEKLTDAVNGDDNGEHWRITTSGGTQYYFGLNRLPGYETGDAETNSTATVPVFGNHAGEPCHATDFVDSVCDQAWRWQLDWVVDTHGNAIAYHYASETNYYVHIYEEAPFDYDRALNLTRIDYGLRSIDGYAGATNQVVFDLVDRCVEGAVCDSDHPENWPDVPLDQACTADATGCGSYGPTFWTDQMLASITTQVKVNGAWSKVDSWGLDHSFPDPGDTTRAGLWLDGITRTGHVGGTIALPTVTFDGVQLYNRVQKTLDTQAPMNWFRISAVHNGTGGVTTVNYTDIECDAKNGIMPASPEANDMRCMPVIVTSAADNGGAPEYDWYHKYLVTEVAEIDTVGTSPSITTTYEYVGDPAWRFADDDGLTDPDYKTWNQYRGYGTVRSITGDGSDARSVTETTFFRGLDAQELPDGTTPSVTVDGITDHDEYAGRPRTQTNYLDGAVLSKTTYTPWRSAPTATRVRDWGTVEARYTGTSLVESTSKLADGTWRTVASETTYDSWGMAVATESSGDKAVDGDEDCTRITYARNEDKWIVDTVVRTEVLSVACDVEPSYPDDVISDELLYYDGATDFPTAPTKGDMTSAEILSSYSGTTPRYLNIGSVTVDEYGRGETSTDIDGNTTTTTYTPATGGPVTAVTTVNPLGHEQTQIIDPLRGNTLQSVDANGNLTEMQYDALGRLTAGWTPDRTRADGYEPASTFEYLLRDDAPSVTITSGINPNNTHTTTYELFDGLGRSIQTQLPAPDGGRILTATFYDTRGKVHKQHGAFYNNADPSTELFLASDNDVPGTIAYEYDTALRQTAEITYSFGIEQYRTTSIFNGDEITVIDPDGRGATSVLDAKGNTVEVRNLHTADPAGAFDAITYDYNPAGQVIAMTDPGGSTWTYEYDILGRRTASNDPDTGRTETTYFDNGLTESVTDVTGQSLWYEYDELGRPIYVMRDDFYGDLVEAYEYDLFGDGLPATSSTWDEDGNLYKTRVLAYDDASRPVGIRYTLDGDFGALDRSFDFRYSYNPDGSVARTSYPSGGSLAIEDVITTYSDLGLPQATYSARQWYVSDTEYTKFAEVSQLTMDPDGPNAAGAPVAWQAYTYEDGTRRQVGSTFQISTGPDHVVTDLVYAYTDAGLITSIDNQSDHGADTQCFTYDYLKRITDAWTGSTPAACDAEPTSTGDIGGTAPYWQSWTFDEDGNRSSQVDHLAGETIDYTYDAAQPHTATSAQITTAESTQTLDYAYDATGNTITRPDENGQVQNLTWSPEGQLETVETDGDVTDFDYTADGTRISRTDPDGTMTLFLPGMELVKDADGTVTASRYYTHGGQTAAIRTNDDAVYWLAGDHQGTTTASVRAATHDTDIRHFDLYGNQRGLESTGWVDDRGFLGGTEDPTGLTHLGAREYDPLLGRFISADPVIDPLDSQQMGGYAYANHSPVSFSDPSGLKPGQWMADTVGMACMYGTAQQCKDAKAGVSAQEEEEVLAEETDAAWDELSAEGITEDVVEAAQDIMNTSLLDVVIEAGLSILLDFLGVNDIMACVGQGDMWACGSLLLDFIPWAKVFKIVGKLAKAAKKIYKAITGFQEKLTWARNIIRKYEDAMDRAYERAQQRISDLRAKRGEATTSELPCNSFTADTHVVLADGTTKPIDQLQPGEEVLATDETNGRTEAREVVTTMEKTAERTLVDFSIDTDRDGVADATVTATDEHPMWIADPATTTEYILAQSVNQDADTPADPSATEGLTSAGGGDPPFDDPIATTEDNDTTGNTIAAAADQETPADPLPGQWVDAIDLKTGQLLRTSAGTWIQITAIETRTEHATVYNLTVADLHTYYVKAANTDFLTHNDGGDLCDIADGGEDYYRTMSEADFKAFEETGNIPATSETFISTEQAYSEKYDGVLVKFTATSGTLDALKGIGVSHNRGVSRAAFPSLPVGGKGWTMNSAMFKMEGGVMNIGLGRGAALNLFNSSIKTFEVLRR